MQNSVAQQTSLILNEQGRIYHLDLKPGEVAKTIIFVGDPARVPEVSKYFDKIELKRIKREFVTHTGYLNDQRITVLSTGMGVGNIDIVMNELDALFNIDFQTREIKKTLTSLDIIRLGTCGGLQADIAVDQIVISDYALAYDGLLNFYRSPLLDEEKKLIHQAQEYFKQLTVARNFYGAAADQRLLARFGKDLHHGITLTSVGFYGPQYRHLRAPLIDTNLFDLTDGFAFDDLHIVNFEMETAAIYAMARLLGHRACSISAVIANRKRDEFSRDPKAAVENMIEFAFERL